MLACLIFLSGTLVFLLGNIESAAATDAATPERITIAYCEDCLPFQYTGDDGRAYGTTVSFWRLWSEKTGIKVNLVSAPWNETLAMVRDGRADAHAGLFYNQDRDEYLDYGAPLHDIDTHAFLHRDLPPITNLRELTAYRVGVVRGDFVENYLNQRLGEGSVISYTTYAEMIDAAM